MKTSPGKRPARVASVVREAIAPVLRECPRECGIVSITEVEVSPDISYATVSIGALSEPKLALAFLEEKKKELQHTVAKKLEVYRMPKIRFRLDDRGERGERIDRLLEKNLTENPRHKTQDTNRHEG